MKKKIVIWGASGHALVVVDILRLNAEFEIVGFIDDVNPDSVGSNFCGLPILGGREQLSILPAQGADQILLAFGNCSARLHLAALARTHGFTLATALHPAATIARDVTIGAGSVVAAGAVINPGCRIGENVIVNTCASVDHQSVVSDGSHICPGVRLAGRVSIGKAAWVGIGSTVIDGVHVGDGAFVGAGSVVVKDIPDQMLAYGVPAKIIKRISP